MSEMPSFLRRNPALAELMIGNCSVTPEFMDARRIIEKGLVQSLSRKNRRADEPTGDSRIKGSALYVDALLPLPPPGYQQGVGLLVLQAELPEGFSKSSARLPLPGHKIWSSLIQAYESNASWRKECKRMKRPARYAQAMFGCVVSTEGEAELISVSVRYLDAEGIPGAGECNCDDSDPIAALVHAYADRATLLPNKKTATIAAPPPPREDFAFYTWIKGYEDDPGTLGDLARHILNDPQWPSNRSEKGPLRAYLRQSENEELVAVLALALDRFGVEAATTTHQPAEPVNPYGPKGQWDLPMATSRALKIGLGIWFDLHEPDPAALADLVAAQNPAAMCLAGIRKATRAETAAEGKAMLCAALDGHNFALAALVLGYLAANDEAEDTDASERYWTRALDLGNKEAAIQLILTHVIDPMLGSDGGLDLGDDEAQALLNTYYKLGGTFGEAVEGILTQCDDVDWEEVEPLYRAAAADGWTSAFVHLAHFLKFDVEDVETGDEVMTEGALAGDVTCAYSDAVKVVCDSVDDAELAAASLTIKKNAENCIPTAIALLGALHLDGVGVDEDPAYGAFLLTVSGALGSDAVFTEFTARRIPHPNPPDWKRIVGWLTDRARETRNEAAMQLVAAVRYVIGTDV